MTDPFRERLASILHNDLHLRASENIHRQGQGKVRNVDLMAKQNAASHNTSKFVFVTSNLNTPIFRRGQPFSLKIHFNGGFELTGRNLRLDFSFGRGPEPGRGTLAQLPVTDSPNIPDNNDWGVAVTSRSQNSIILQVKPSPQSPVGLWFMTVVTQPGNQHYNVGQHIYILFNPWCTEDSVYMQNDAWRNEYVLNDRGIVYKENGPVSWAFKQFDRAALMAVLYGLEMSEVLDSKRGYPIDVCRALTCLGNKSILWGRWDGQYKDGREPKSWTGTHDILTEYMKTKEKVKYGQCWVYSGITTTFCRALGIPCRSVTNYDSAHDSNKDLVIDEIWNLNKAISDLRTIEGAGMDSSWNFHVWNDAWMTRPDLPVGYGGWQAIDATAQEFSPHRKENPHGLYECGPASMEAIKKGEVGHQYDTLFVFTEVNGDKRLWQTLPDGSTIFKATNESIFGSKILTKAVGSNDTQEVTLEYKFREGSQEERAAMHKAARMAGVEDKLKKPIPSVIKDDVFFNLMQIDARTIGQPLRISVQVSNRSGKNRQIDVSLGAHSVEYTGYATHELDVSENKAEAPYYRKKLDTGPEDQEIVTTTIKPEIYIDKMSYLGHVRVFATGVVKETNQVWMKSHTIVIRTPKLKFDMPPELPVGRPARIGLRFTNPLQKELSNCSFSVEASFTEQAMHFNFRNVKPGEEVIHEIKMTPERTGPGGISGIFNSNLLSNVTGAKECQVF